ncbi:UDP-N-acetylmuramoyl-L-alanine--D-glutamate ligase [Pseudomonadota bacterium]|nr:UDP-N-acetylmuramoyl-L-alanine--D-glutamate ligase [Pseudomonadota bacterium]
MISLAEKADKAKSILIIGIGKSGLSSARFLVKHGYTVAMMDTREKPPGLKILQTELPEVLIITGGLNESIMLQADMIILSPGIDPRLPEIVAAKRKNIELVGDVELFAREANAPIIAITGSNGKSTVTTLLAEMAIESDKKVQVGGNLGTPVLELLIDPAPDFYIVELSSFQLETVRSLNAFVATVLNVTPDHMDRYDTEQEYKEAKATIYNGNGVMVLNRDDKNVMQLTRDDRNQVHFSLDACEGVDFGLLRKEGVTWLAEGSHALLQVDELMIKGKHNVANALASLAIGSAMGLSMVAMLTILKRYPGLPHRCNLVASINGVNWINDSKATNVGACIAAIEGLTGSGKIILIAGGVAKDQDFTDLAAAINKYVSAVIVLGQDAELILEAVSKDVNTYYVETIDCAVKQAKDIAESGSNVLLSPACASFDMFSGYEQRGKAFETSVEKLV